MKNKFFTNELVRFANTVLTPKFAGIGRMEDYHMDIKIEEPYLALARELHRAYPVADAHLDLAAEILFRHQAGEHNVIRNHYLPDFRSAGIKLVVSSVFVEDYDLERSWQVALDQINALKEDMKGLSAVTLITGKEDIDRILGNDQIGILLYMEGLDCIHEDIDKLNILYDLGVRGASLTWSRPNALATGCCKAREHRPIPGPLTKAGILAVKRLEDLSMFLDISHLNDEGFSQVCKIASRSFIATHSCSRHVFDSYRNMTDEQMRLLASQGGIMGLNGCQCIAGSLQGNHFEMLCRHVEYEVEKIGPEHVGYGFDLCDSYEEAEAAVHNRVFDGRSDCLSNHGQIYLVTAALLQRGMDRGTLELIIGKNFINYFRKMLPD